MRRRAGYCPCALYRGSARIVRRASLGPSDKCPTRALNCYYLALSAEIFDGFPNIDWTYIAHPRYPSKWVRHTLHKVPYPRIVYRRLRRCRREVDAMEFDERCLMSQSPRSARAVQKRAEFFDLWVENLNAFLDRAENEIAEWLP